MKATGFAIVAAVLVGLAALGWPVIKIFWTSHQYNKVHYTAFQSATIKRLETLAEQAAAILNDPAATNTVYWRGGLPSQFADLDPTFVSIRPETKEIDMEFAGGFDHYGFHIRPNTKSSNLWTVVRYTEQAGEYESHDFQVPQPAVP